MIDSVKSAALTPALSKAPPGGKKPVVSKDAFVSAEDLGAGLMKPLSFRTDLAGADSLRPMTAQEKSDFQSWFPALDVDKAVVSGEATQQFNCISWTTGNTKSWDWPPSMYPGESPQDAFKTYYSGRGFSPVSSEAAAKMGGDKELVAYWEDSNGPTHGSVHGPSHGDRWESKCGQAARIRHDRDELVSDTYGEIKGYWVKTGAPSIQPAPPLTREVAGQIQDKLDARLAAVNPEVQAKFSKAYGEWQTFRQSPQVSAASDPAAYCKGQAFQKLVDLGPAALPLFIDKAVQGDHFTHYAIESISKQEANRPTKSLTPVAELRAQKVDCSEQDKVQQVLVQWLGSNW